MLLGYLSLSRYVRDFQDSPVDIDCFILRCARVNTVFVVLDTEIVKDEKQKLLWQPVEGRIVVLAHRNLSRG